MSDNGHILIVDDQREICDLVQEYLSGEGYRTSTAQSGAEMRRVMAQSPVDLVILDLMLPGEDGLTLARSLRQDLPNVGIIILTGRGEIVDRIIGLEMGADDYLPKPFHLRELLARVKSVLRRASSTGAERQSGQPRSKARFAGWHLDLASRELFSPAGKEIRLTTGEFDLLAAFVNNANQVLSRDRLLDLARNREAGPFDRTIDVQVGRLRRKLEDDPQRPTMIKTVRGSGYIFTPSVEVTEGPHSGSPDRHLHRTLRADYIVKWRSPPHRPCPARPEWVISRPSGPRARVVDRQSLLDRQRIQHADPDRPPASRCGRTKAKPTKHRLGSKRTRICPNPPDHVRSRATGPCILSHVRPG